MVGIYKVVKVVYIAYNYNIEGEDVKLCITIVVRGGDASVRNASANQATGAYRKHTAAKTTT